VSTRRALVIGCTAADYPGVETSARAFAAVLRARHRFTAIECLIAAKATAANIHSAFAALTAATGPGDVVVIYYAGHASHFRLDVPEGAGQLRITLIAPAGVEQSTPDDFRGLLGADFSALIQGVLCQTDNVTVILDCCDGENMVDLVTVDRAPELRRALEGKLRRIAAERFADHGEHHETPCVRPRGPGFVLVSASAAGGIAFVHPRGGRLLFTSLLCQALAKPNAVQRSWQELLAMVHADLRPRRSAQLPAVSGGRFFRPFSWYQARPDHEFMLGLASRGRVEMPAPEFLHGVELDDRFELVTFADRDASPRSLGDAVVEALTPRLILRAVDRRVSLPRIVYARQRVLRDAGLDIERAAADALQPGATPQALFPDIRTGERLGATVRHNPAREAIDVHDHEGHLVTRVQADRPDRLDRVRSATRRVLRWQHLRAALKAPKYQPFTADFSIGWGELAATTTEITERPLTDDTLLQVGRPMFLRLTSRTPNLYVRAYRVRADRAILPWDDHEWSTSVADEETRTLGRELWGHTRGLTLDWPHHALPDRDAPNEAHEWLLLIASDTPFSRELLRCDDACEAPPAARPPGPRFYLHLFPYRLTR